MREHKEIERSIILGNLSEAALKINALLQKDPYNFRTIELLCEANKLLGTPEQVYAFVATQQLDAHKLNVPTQLVVADSLAEIKKPSAQVTAFLKLLLEAASNNHLHEAEAKRLAFSLRSLGNHEEAIAVINRTLLAHPTLRSNPGLMRIRGEAHIDLAKRCMETARNDRSSSRIRARAWDQCRSFLDEAERDLRTAIEHAGSALEREPLERALDFLESLRHRARRPGGPSRPR